jgi:hypothetical protein
MQAANLDGTSCIRLPGVISLGMRRRHRLRLADFPQHRLSGDLVQSGSATRKDPVIREEGGNWHAAPLLAASE